MQPPPHRDLRDPDVARRRSLFREVNEHIRDVNTRFAVADRANSILCECGDAACMRQVEVRAAVHGEVAKDPARFLVAPGHVAPAERVVQNAASYCVAEVEPPGSVADAAPPVIGSPSIVPAA